MLRTIIIFVAALGVVGVLFTVYVSWDTTPVPRKTIAPTELIRRPLTTQPTSQTAGIDIRGNKVSPGLAPIVRVIDPETGESRIVLQGTEWKPLSDTTFDVTQPAGRVLLPGGQLAYVRADRGEVVIQRDEKNNYNPKRGKLIGNVQLFIDRSKPEWRKANPDLVDPEQHPEAVVKIWMDDVSFDLDLARLQTSGPITVQNIDATIEGRGLTLVWNEVNRHIKLLKIDEGKRASVRVRSLTQLGIARTDEEGNVSANIGNQGPTSPEAVTEASDATDNTEASEEDTPETAPAPEQKASQIRLADLDDREDVKPNRIDTYQIVFKDKVIAEQRQGMRIVGSLQADVLELLRDFGEHERSAVEHAPTTRPAGAKSKGKNKHAKAEHAAVASAPSDTDAAKTMAKKDSTLELRWSGELVVTPLVQTQTQPALGANRFHLTATGNPVRLHDKETGDATCRKLEFRDETQEIWLTGTPDDFVTLQADARRQIAGEKVFLDRKGGLARVEGAGRMIDQRGDKAEKELPECVREVIHKAAQSKPAGKKAGEEDDKRVVVTWKQGIEVRFGLQKTTQPNPAGGPDVTKVKEYLKSATFDGEVSFTQPGQVMSADHIDITFAEPASGEPTAANPLAARDRSVAAETVHAKGHVHMLNDRSTIDCDRLDVEMTTNDVGDNVPKIGQAYGNVVARQGEQEIRAAESMVVALDSIPRKIDPLERERYELAAKTCGYTSESPEYKAMQAKLSERRDTILRTLVAKRDVVVLDPHENVDVAAETLECSFDDNQQIVRAIVMGSKEVPAHVAMTDFYVRGPQINFNVAEQSADVPGEGILRFYTKQDLSGRRVDEAVPVVVTWKSGMTFRGRQNTGMFTGQVRTVSQNTVLDCRELNLRFESLPTEQASSQPAGSDSRWLAGKVIDLLAERESEKSNTSAAGISRDMRKRLSYVQAIGDCVIASSEYEQRGQAHGPFSALMAGIMPDAVRKLEKAPSPQEQRLQSFIRVAGPRVTIDLNNEHMVVEGAGNLLVLDYRMPKDGGVVRASADNTGDLLAGSLQSGGPSQTVFTWQNSMSYLNRRNVAVLDNQVVMKHAAGSEMAMPDQVATAMKIDPKKLAAARGRRAELTCENLVVEFARNNNQPEAMAGSLTSAAQLKAFQASQRVRMQENSRAVEGELITYDSSSGLVRILGSAQLPAWGAEIDERTGALRVSWRGQELLWNLKTSVITAKGSSITASGR